MPRGFGGTFAAQQFNTTTSMGRLTLNVLLSFAQRARGHLRADQGQDLGIQAQGAMGRRHRAARL